MLNGERVMALHGESVAWGLMGMTIEAAIEVCRRNGWTVEEINNQPIPNPL